MGVLWFLGTPGTMSGTPTGVVGESVGVIVAIHAGAGCPSGRRAVCDAPAALGQLGVTYGN
jgi:hypothetical protein